MEIVPNGSNRFKSSDMRALYIEVYEPALEAADRKLPLQVAVQLKVLDAKTGEAKVDSGLINVPLPEKTGNPVLPVGLKMPLNGLAPGDYRLEMTALDTARQPVKSSADFVVE